MKKGTKYHRRRSGVLISDPYPLSSDAYSVRTVRLGQVARDLGADVWLASPEGDTDTLAFKRIPLPYAGRIELGRTELLETFRLFISSFFVCFNMIMKRRVLKVVQFSQVGNPLYAVITMFVAKALRLKVVYDMDDPAPEYVSSRYGLSDTSTLVRASFFLEKLICLSSDLVVVVSFSMARLLRRASPRKVAVVYNAICIDRVAPFVSRQQPIPIELPSGFRVVYFGRIERKIRGLEEALSAFTQLDESFYLIMVGSGDGEKPLTELSSRLGLEGRVTIVGPYPTPSLYSIVKECNAVIIPYSSDFEGHRVCPPTKLFEAVALEKPVICPDAPAFREVLGDLGIYYRSNSPNLMAQAIHRASSEQRDQSEEPQIRARSLAAFLDKFQNVTSYENSLSKLLCS